MPRIGIPLAFDELNCKPSLAPMVSVNNEMEQALSLLSAYDGVQRKLLRCSPTGILHTIGPRVQACINVTGSGANDTWQGSAIKTTEVMIRANANNAALIWINVDIAAAADTGWPLAGGEVLNITVNNLNNVHALIVGDGEKLIVLYSR